MIKVKKDNLYLVTGGSGFLGFDLVQRILSQGGRVVTLSRDEGKLIELKQQYPNIEILTGFYRVESDPKEKKKMKRGETGLTLVNASDAKITGVIKNCTTGISIKNLQRSSLDISLTGCGKLGDADESFKQNNIQLVSTNKDGKSDILVNRL